MNYLISLNQGNILSYTIVVDSCPGESETDLIFKKIENISEPNYSYKNKNLRWVRTIQCFKRKT